MPTDETLDQLLRDFSLGDDGTMDTVIVHDETGIEIRFSTESAYSYRDETGVLDLGSFLIDHEDELYDKVSAQQDPW